jgi:hypothetical protein
MCFLESPRLSQHELIPSIMSTVAVGIQLCPLTGVGTFEVNAVGYQPTRVTFSPSSLAMPASRRSAVTNLASSSV